MKILAKKKIIMYYESFMCITNDAGLIAYYYFASYFPDNS